MEREYTKTSKTTKNKANLFSIFYRDVWKIQVEHKIKHSADKGSGNDLTEPPRNSTKANAKTCSTGTNCKVKQLY